MITSIAVRNLNVTTYRTDKYAIVFMYFEERKKRNEKIKAMIIKKIHLIKDSKVDLMIENNILNSKLIDLSTSTNTFYNESCDVTISIFIKTKFIFQNLSVHVLHTVIISFIIEQVLGIHNITLFDPDYLFESIENVNFSIYAHMINTNTNFILIRNDTAKFIKVLRNFRLKTINEINYINVYVIDIEALDLAIRLAKLDHKNA